MFLVIEMEVQAEVLEKLVCYYCGEYLSIGPVLLLEEERNVCGRCAAPDPKEQTVLRNTSYELLAKNLLFPCQNKRYGCTIKQRFNSIKSHEATCAFRRYTCFLLQTRSCNWLGVKTDVLKHYNTKHSDRLIKNPVIFQYNVTRTSIENFLMTAFNMLFVIHTKVCLQTRKIYHCVRLFGDAGNTKDYSYTLDICRGRSILSKKGEVFPEGCLSLKESDSMAVGINNLIDIFGGYTGTSFKLTVNSLVKEPQVPLRLKRKFKGFSIKEMSCDKCKISITYRLAYYDNKKWKCTNCIEHNVKCEFKHTGCAFTSTFNKAWIHSWFYCNYRTTCSICNSPVGDSIANHYDIAHSNISYMAGESFTERVSRYMFKNLIITTEIGQLHCSHILHDSQFHFFISSPLDSGELHYYTLELEFQSPAMKYTLHKSAPIYNSSTHFSDWYLEIKHEEFIQCVANGKFVLTLTITKVKNHINMF